jgi:hypothetical protein
LGCRGRHTHTTARSTPVSNAGARGQGRGTQQDCTTPTAHHHGRRCDHLAPATDLHGGHGEMWRSETLLRRCKIASKVSVGVLGARSTLSMLRAALTCALLGAAIAQCPKSCSLHGVCQSIGFTATCVCFPGYSGVDCSSSTSCSCAPSPSPRHSPTCGGTEAVASALCSPPLPSNLGTSCPVKHARRVLRCCRNAQ